MLFTFIGLFVIMGSFVCLKIPVMVRALVHGSYFWHFPMSFFMLIGENWKSPELHTDYIHTILLYYESHYICKVNQNKQKNFHFFFIHRVLCGMSLLIYFRWSLPHSESLLKVGTYYISSNCSRRKVHCILSISFMQLG